MPKPYNPTDKWFLAAKREGFRARSVYKLIDIDQKFNLLRKGMSVLDLGAAPGSWLQYISQVIQDGFALGLDLQKIKPIAQNIKTEICDILDSKELQECLDKYSLTFDLVVSDLAPSTTGVKYADQQRSLELSYAVVDIAQIYLNTGGNLVIKYFQGPKSDKLISYLKKSYEKVSVTKPQASRDRSKEMYLICQGKR